MTQLTLFDMEPQKAKTDVLDDDKRKPKRTEKRILAAGLDLTDHHSLFQPGRAVAFRHDGTIYGYYMDDDETNGLFNMALLGTILKQNPQSLGVAKNKGRTFIQTTAMHERVQLRYIIAQLWEWSDRGWVKVGREVL